MNQNFFMHDDAALQDLGEGISRKILAHAENMMTVQVYFEKDAIGKIHTHIHEQITYILDGVFEFNVDGDKRVVRAGDTIYKQPNVPHGAVCLEKGSLLDIFTPHREDFL